MLPELAGAPVPSHADSGVERRLLFEAISSLLASLGPTLMVLDDLHWADPSSLALLAYLAAEPLLDEMVMLATVRTVDLDPTAAAALSDLGRISHVDRVPLRGLEPADVARLVEAVTAGGGPPGLLQRVTEACEGNALFVEELAEYLLNIDTEPSERFDTASSLPERIRHTLNRRIDALGAPGRALLATGAMLGRDSTPASPATWPDSIHPR